MPSRTRTWVYAISAVLLAALVAFGARAFRGSGPAVPGRGKARIGQTEAGAGIRVGAPQTFDSLALFAVFSDGEQDVGPMTSLPAALAEGSALVREMGAGAGEGAVNEREQQNGQLRRHRGDVLSFIQQIDAEQAEERSTPADNVNEYKKAKAGYGSSTRLKGVSPSAKPAAPLSKDYAAK